MFFQQSRQRNHKFLAVPYDTQKRAAEDCDGVWD